MGRGAGTRAAWRLVLLLLVASVRATRRFVNVNGAVEAADDVTRANVLQSPRAPVACDDTAVGDTCATLSESRIDMDTLMDAGFIEMYASSVSAPLAKGYGTVGTDRSSQRGGHNGKSNLAFAKRRDEDRSGLDLQNGRANPLSARADGSAKVEDLSLAEEAYLYDDVFLEDGTVLNEDDFPTVERHKSRTGWDEPSWDALETRWDDLPGISRRAEHLPGFTEPESEKRLIGGMKPSLVRDAMQRKLLELGRGNPIMFGTWGHLGNAFRLMGESHAAVQSLRRALYLKPDDKDALTHLAIVLRDAGYTADAAKIFQYVISLGSATALVHYLLGNQLIELGEPEAALANFQICLQKKPDFKPAAQRLQDLRALMRQGSGSTSASPNKGPSHGGADGGSIFSKGTSNGGDPVGLGSSTNDGLITLEDVGIVLLVGIVVFGLAAFVVRRKAERSRGRRKGSK